MEEETFSSRKGSSPWRGGGGLVYGEGVRILKVEQRSEDLTFVHTVGKSEDSPILFRIWVRPAPSTQELGFVHIYYRSDFGVAWVELKAVPFRLVPFVLQAMGEDPGAYEGPFLEEPGGTDFLAQLVEEFFQEVGVELGSYQRVHGGGWSEPGREGWDPEEYERVVRDYGNLLTPEEVRFRLRHGERFTQEEITREVLLLLGERVGTFP